MPDRALGSVNRDWRDGFGHAVVGHSYRPVVGIARWMLAQGVVQDAQGSEVVRGGRAAVFEGPDVVELAACGWDIAVGKDAAAIAG